MRAVVLLAALVGCASEPVVPLGAWSSDRGLTLASYAQDPSLYESYQAVAEDRTLLGQNVQVFTPHGGIVWFEGECGAPWSYDNHVVHSEPGVLRYRDDASGEERTITWNAEFMYYSLAGGRAHEVFRKIPIEQAFREHTCLQQIREIR